MARHALVVGIDDYPNFPAYPLVGCVRDAESFTRVLTRRFGFPREAVTLLLDREATRDGILAAFDGVAGRLSPGDQLVFFYSGHGSQVDGSDEPDGWDETLVPSDSGRGDGRPCRDIVDDEIHDRLLTISRVTPYVTVVFDTCHSGGTLRRHPDYNERWVPAGRRPDTPLRRSRGTRSGGSRREVGAASWLPPRERVVFVAACGPDEPACEWKEEPRQGALTYTLCRELERAAPGESWRSVFERVRSLVRTSFPRQHPRLEGAVDRELFGTRSAPAAVPVPAAGGQAATASPPRSRYEHLLELASREGSGALDRPPRATILRRRGEGWSAAEAERGGRVPVFRDGERLALRVENAAGLPLYLEVLDLGLAGGVSHLYPPPGGSKPLAPARRLEIGVRRGDELAVRIPAGMAPGADGVAGREVLLVLAAAVEEDLGVLVRSVRAAAAGTGNAELDFPAGGWALVVVELDVAAS